MAWFLSSLLTVVVATPAQTSVRYVAPGGNDAGNDCTSSATPCASVQRAVAQSATSGDEIRVASGIFLFVDSATDNPCLGFQNPAPVLCILNKSVLMVGGFEPPSWSAPSPAAAPSVIDGQSARRGASILQTSATLVNLHVELRGFLFRNGLTQGKTTGTFNDRAGFGGAMRVDAVRLTLRDVRFENNTSTGGSVTSGDGGFGSGGGLAILNRPLRCQGIDSTVTLVDVEFEGNVAQGGSSPVRGGDGNGGGLFVDWANLVGRSLHFVDNESRGGPTTGDPPGLYEGAYGLGGGAAFKPGSSATLSSIVATGNLALGGNWSSGRGGVAFGGGLYFEGHGTSTNLCNPPATHQDPTEVDVEEFHLARNEARGGTGEEGGTGGGGGALFYWATGELRRGIVVDNIARGGDGSAFAGGPAGGGLNLWVTESGPGLTVRDTVMASNLAAAGATGELRGGGGGGIFLDGIDVTMDHITLAANRLSDSFLLGLGAVLIQGAFLDLRHSLVADHADAPGAGIASALHAQPDAGTGVAFVDGYFSGNAKDTGGGGAFLALDQMAEASALTFRAPGAPEFDFHLDERSLQSVVDAAEASGEAVDVDGEARDDTPDVGADEASSLLFWDDFESTGLLRWR